MPFRLRQKIVYSGSCSVKVPISSVSPDGTITTAYEDACKALPDRENFRLGNLLKAGVPIEQVSTKILGSDSVDLGSVSKPSKAKVTETKVIEPKSSETNDNNQPSTNNKEN